MTAHNNLPASTRTSGQYIWEMVKGAALIAAALSVIVFLAISGWQVQEELAKFGAAAQATVTSTRDAGDKGGAYIAYTFRVPVSQTEAQTFEGRSWAATGTLKRGDTVTVLYSTRQPQVSVAVSGYAPARTLTGFARTFFDGNSALIFTGALFAGLGGYFIARAGRSLKSALRLEREGCDGNGEIENRGAARIQNNHDGNSTSYWVSYRFQAAGKTYTLRETVGQAQYQKWTPAAKITVRYLPDNPHIARITG